MKILGNYRFYWGDLRGAKFISGRLIFGWVAKLRNNLYFRIIGQGKIP
jgi:hypothetical protein